jgi:hypothetical protein
MRQQCDARVLKPDDAARSPPAYPSSKDSDSIPMFFSPAAFFSRYFFTQAAKLLPAAVSFPVKATAAISV